MLLMYMRSLCHQHRAAAEISRSVACYARFVSVVNGLSASEGMAAAAVEALHAARAAGCEDWLRDHICEELAAAGASTLARLEKGSYQHALRRSHEMAATAELLGELGVPPRIAHASQLWLEDLAEQSGGR